jgi:hypothetical protein
LDESTEEFDERLRGLRLPFEHCALSDWSYLEMFDCWERGAGGGEDWGREAGRVAFGVEYLDAIGKEGCWIGGQGDR